MAFNHSKTIGLGLGLDLYLQECSRTMNVIINDNI